MATPNPGAMPNLAERIVVLDGLYSDAFVHEMQERLLKRGWTYSEGAHPGAELVHWVTELAADDAWVKTLLAGFSRQVQHLMFSRNASAGVLYPRHFLGVELTAHVISSISRAV